MPQEKNKTREQQYSLADREKIMADLIKDKYLCGDIDIDQFIY